jgi:guanylate kinase
MNAAAQSKGLIIVLSAPSGAGKHTILTRARTEDPNLVYSVSATTRPPRDGEVDGRDYHFVGREEFERRVEAGEFVEWAEVHGNLYGTLRAELDRLVNSGNDVLLELDVQGMRNLRRFGLDTVSVFIMAPSEDELERRIRARGANTEADMEIRLRNARQEMKATDEYDHVIVNDDLDRAVREFQQLIQARREQRA